MAEAAPDSGASPQAVLLPRHKLSPSCRRTRTGPWWRGEDEQKCQTRSVAENVRCAVVADVEEMAAMADARRNRYARYQPVFWRPASNAAEVQRPYLAKLVGDQDVMTLVSEESGTLTGFLIATIRPSPPVYDPGSLTCSIDDFDVIPGRWATTGVRLLRSAIERARERGAIQTVVVTAHLDEAKRAALRTCGLAIASEWWVTS